MHQAVQDCLAPFGGARGILGQGRHVALKPNLLMPHAPQLATCTHPAVIEAVADAFVQVGARVTVCESPGGPYSASLLALLYRVCGLSHLKDNPHIMLNMDTRVQETACPQGRVVKEMSLIAPLLEADLIISIAKAKTHGLACYSGAVKNLFGAVPGLTKAALHGKYPDLDDFFGMLVDVCERLAPAFSFIDAIEGMEGNGPSGGTPKKLGALIAAPNPHAADMAAVDLMGLVPRMVLTLREGIKRGLIVRSPDELTWMGDDPAALRTRFALARPNQKGGWAFFTPKPLRRLIHKFTAPYPVVAERCVGCGDCARICPKQCIHIGDGQKARIDTNQCMRCYCCHEICPVQAIDL